MNGDIFFEIIDMYILECYFDNEIKSDQNYREVEFFKEFSINNWLVFVVVEIEIGEFLLYLRCMFFINYIEIYVWYSMVWLNLFLIRVLKQDVSVIFDK